MGSHQRLYVFLPRLRLALGRHGIPLEEARAICDGIIAGAPPQPVRTLKDYWRGRAITAAMENLQIDHKSQAATWNTALCKRLFDFENAYAENDGTQLGRIPIVEDRGSC
jgi:hypothetical protein